MKVYVVEFTDPTDCRESGILGIYDNLEDAQKRVDNFSKHLIKKGSLKLIQQAVLGKTEIIAYDMNQAVFCCAAEVMEEN